MLRTHTCGELRIGDTGTSVTLCGWIQRIREMGGMTFIDLRDRYGITQLTFNYQTQSDQFEKLKQLGREFVISAKGIVAERSNKNPKIPTGDIEIHVDSFEILNPSVIPPFTVEDNTVNASHFYSFPGVYVVSVSFPGSSGEMNVIQYKYVVVYDPNGSFVTGGGWIISPAGAYKANLSLTGKANFGFVSKYKKGQTIPEGNTEFQFNAANLNFRSLNYEWLVIAGSKAMFKGSGTISGTGNYGFLLSAIDGNLSGTIIPDKFRIKIWDKNNNDLVVYDNNLIEELDSDPETDISGGSIVIHTVTKKSASR